MALFQQAVIIMVLGMGLTFAFLWLVIQSVRLTGWLVCRRETLPKPEADGMDRGALAAAVAAALHEHDAQTGERI
jgi:sodium pump decarboxylase gamma subunit